MKKFYSISVLALSALSVGAQLPGELSWSDYDGISFAANWENTAEVDLSVFSNSGKEGNQSVTFADIIKNGKINMFAAASLEPMFTLSFKEGLQAVGEVDGTNAVVMSSTDDAITIMVPNGFLRSLVVKGKVIGADNTSDYDVSPYLKLTALEYNGSSTGFEFSTYAYQLNDTYNGECNYYEKLLGYYFKTLSGVKLSFVKADHMVGDLAITSIECTYEGRDYLIEKQAVNGSSYVVDGCDPELPYFYYLTSKDGNTVTPIMTVDGFIPPSTLEAKQTSPTSFTASWSKAYKADEVVVANYEVKSYPDGGTAYVYYDNFDKADEGTLELPQMVSSLDPYTEASGWETYPYAGRIAEGMIGTFKSFRSYPVQGGYLYSPALDLTGNDGKYTISTRLYGTPGDVITVYRAESYENYNIIGHKLTVGEDGWVEDEWEMTDGQFAANGEPVQSIRFESASLETFLLDYLYVSQEVPAGHSQYIPCGAPVTVDASENETEFFGLNEGGEYAFRVKSVGVDLLGVERNSEWSDYIHISLVTTGIENITDSINTSDFDPEAAAIYFTPDGKIVDAQTRGLIIVRQGDKTFKLIR